MTAYLHGLHEPGGEHLMAGRPGWIVFTEAIGADPAVTTGRDYRPWADAGYGIIARLNNGYDGAGTLPEWGKYEDFAQRVANYITHSQGCTLWIVGNEPNHEQEWPGGVPIYPWDYATAFKLCRALVPEPHTLLVAGPAPWYALPYVGNERGDWVQYLKDVLAACGEYDGVALHAYTHGSDPALITSTARMDPPFEDRYYEWGAVYHQAWIVPAGKEIYITECNPGANGEPWPDVDTGWVRAAFEDVNEWNHQQAERTIRALCLYRWPNYDKWQIVNKPAIHQAFKDVVAVGYKWKDDTEEEPPVTVELQNPGFEGTFYKFNGIGELILANGWKPWFSEEGGHHRPEFKAETLTTGRAHVRTGSRAQKQFTTFSTHDGGIYQRIEGVTPGQWYTFSAWVWVWSTDSRENPATSLPPDGKYSALVGINPWGDERPLYRTTVWGKEALAVYDQWVQVSVTAQAWSNAIVICTRGNPEWPVKANDSYWDDCALTLADFATPEPPPVEPPVEPPPVGADVDYDEVERRVLSALAAWDRR